MRHSNTLAPTLAAPRFFAVPVLHDNYAWVVVGENNQAIVVDPGEATPVVAALARHNLTLVAILATHHHHDHVGGIAALVDGAQGSVQVWASGYDIERSRIPRATHVACDNVPFEVAGAKFVPLAVPGHTLGAVAYWNEADALLFTGDTLFLAGCGRLFEGDAALMWQSLQRLRALPGETRICCGHDYVGKNLRFAGTVLPATDVAATDDARATDPTLDAGGTHASPPLVPPFATLATELQRNPFLRADNPLLQEATGLRQGALVFAELRRRRDSFA